MDSVFYALMKATSRTVQNAERLELVLRIYRTLGVLIAVMAVAFFTANKFDIKLDNKDQAALTVAAIAAATAFFSNFGVEFLRQKKKLLTLNEKKAALSSSLLTSWADLEKMVLHIGASDRTTPISIRALLKEIANKGLVSSSQIERLEAALRTRNLIAHGIDDTVSNDEIVAALEVISDTIAELYPNRDVRLPGVAASKTD